MPQTLQAAPEAVIDFLKPLQPRLTSPLSDQPTENTGVYWYTDLGRGSGWLRVEDLNVFDALRLDELGRLDEINRTIGFTDPVRQPDIKYGSAFVVHNQNPYVQMICGGFYTSMGVVMILVGLFMPVEPPLAQITILTFGVILIGVAPIVIARGVKRLAWWKAARAQALRDGGQLPVDLTIGG